ncbi:MAG: hypothetical protein RBG13Loki_0154 [Promethearchaeota archaeon CR_4]|nr:MAG: hypothetical protein RBG13Loki_0154 [Candidatus Lokiarchaeota archaeon CR_4]
MPVLLDLLSLVESSVTHNVRLRHIKRREKRIYFKSTVKDTNSELQFYLYDWGSRILLEILLSILILAVFIIVLKNPFWALGLMICLFFIIFAPVKYWKFESGCDTFQRVIKFFGMSLSRRTFPQSIFAHLKFDLRTHLYTLTRGNASKGIFEQRFDNFDTLTSTVSQ